MNRRRQQHRIQGFALIEAMVALLLLAVAAFGAAGAVVAALAGQRGALLRSQAADLASDLAEALRAAPDMLAFHAELRSWQAAVQQQLPSAEAWLLPGSSPAAFTVQLNWRDGGAGAPATLSLPLSLPHSLVLP